MVTSRDSGLSRTIGLKRPTLGRVSLVRLLVLVVLAALCCASCGALPGSGPQRSTAAETAEAALDGSNDAPQAHALVSAAQGYPAEFTTISLDEGLSQSVVTAIVQDGHGLIWLGTQDGLNRYDGYRFTVYKRDPEDPNSLGSSLILSLCVDRAGALWIGTSGGGLNRFDSQTGRFARYANDPDDPTSLSDDIVQVVYEDRDGVLWVGTGAGGLNRFDPETETFTRYRHSEDDARSLINDTVLAVSQDREGVLWIGTVGGLDQFEPDTERFTHFVADPDDPNSLSANTVQAIGEDSEGALWVGTDGGLNQFDSDTGQFIRYLHDPEDPSTVAHDDISTILRDRSGGLWIGTSGSGLDTFDRQTGRFIHHKNDPHEPQSLSNDTVLSSFEDEAGVLWFGTYGGGLSRFDPFRRKFAHFRADPNDPNGLAHNTVWSIWEDGDGALWIGTIGGGLAKFDRDTGRASHMRADPDDPHSISHDFVWSVIEDRDGVLWVGTDVGLDELDRGTGWFHHRPTTVPVFRILQDGAGALWLGTLGAGLGKLEPGAEEIIYHANDPDDPTTISDMTIVDIVEGRDGGLWIATFNGGLNRLDPDTGRFTRYQHDPADVQSLISNNVLSLHLDTEGSLWVGTLDGLDRLDPGQGTFSHFNEDDGLPNNVIYAILEDTISPDLGGPHLWISTNRGLSRFSPETATFRNYDVGDGLQSSEFNQGSAHKSESGEMFFGGINGFNAFYPELVTDNHYIPPVVITDFYLFNELVDVSADSVLRRPIAATDAITLSHRDDFFAFEFAALHYSAPEENQYAYVLEEFDEDWNDVGSRNFAGYTNVPPGRYTFRVRGTNSDGVWNEDGTALSIAITPPFWQTWWFRILAGLAVVGGVVGVFALRVRTIEARRRELEVQVDQRTQELQEALGEVRRAKEAAEAASKAKSVFLANVSHELRTPLNAILGFSQLMIRSARAGDGGRSDLSRDQRENLEVISRSGEHLLGLINDVLDMSKIEAGRTTLSEMEFDLHRMLDGLEEMFRLRAENKGLDLKWERDPRLPQYVRADQGRLRQVLMNLLGNAVKFTEQGGVTARCTVVPPASESPQDLTWLRFEIEDTGLGIAPDEIEAVFDPFVQTAAGRESQEGTGLGLAISREFVRLMGGELAATSELGRGSVFSFAIPAESVLAGAVGTAQPARMVVGLAPGQPLYRILVVDDKDLNRRLLVKLLEPIGFATREAANGQEALDKWDTWEPHLIFMDMRMPVVDGYEATRRIKATTRGQATVIVALTASALEEDRLVILSEGCDAYIRKPFQEDELFDVMAKHLGVRYLYQEAPSGERAAESGGLAGSAELVEAMRALPGAWRDRLRRATIVGDLDQIGASIDSIGEHDLEPDQAATLRDGLTALADSFAHDTILELIEVAGEADE